MKVAASVVKVEGGLAGSKEAIKSVKRVFGCVNGSIGVLGKDKCRLCYFFLVKSKSWLYLEEEGLL